MIDHDLQRDVRQWLLHPQRPALNLLLQPAGVLYLTSCPTSTMIAAMAEIIVCSDASSMLVNLWLIKLIAAVLLEYTNSRHSASGVFRNECRLQAANDSRL